MKKPCHSLIILFEELATKWYAKENLIIFHLWTWLKELLLQKSEERSVAVAVRIHKTLELADDKFYMITCGKAGFQNRNNETSLVTLQLLREGRKVQQVVYGREYTLK